MPSSKHAQVVQGAREPLLHKPYMMATPVFTTSPYARGYLHIAVLVYSHFHESHHRAEPSHPLSTQGYWQIVVPVYHLCHERHRYMCHYDPLSLHLSLLIHGDQSMIATSDNAPTCTQLVNTFANIKSRQLPPVSPLK